MVMLQAIPILAIVPHRLLVGLWDDVTDCGVRHHFSVPHHREHVVRAAIAERGLTIVYIAPCHLV